MSVKCIWYWVWESGTCESDVFLSVSRRFEEAIGESPEAFPRMSRGMSYLLDAGFRLVEGTHEQLLNFVIFWRPIGGWGFVYFEQPDFLMPFVWSEMG